MMKKKISVFTMAEIAMCTALLAVCSWIAVPLTVPVTLQTMAVFLVAGLLGTKKSLVSLLLFFALGAVGVPVFSGFSAGLQVFLGPTGGYLLGFVFTALIVGLACELFGRKIIVLALSMVIGLLVCYAFGTGWFMVVYANRGQSITLGGALALCVTPFLLPDAVKIVLATIVVNRIYPVIKKLESRWNVPSGKEKAE